MAAVQETVDRVRSIEAEAYKYGFVSDIESDKAPKGLNEDVVRFISAKKGEPQWLLDWRLDAYRRWLTHDSAALGAGRIPRDRLPGPLLLLRAEVGCRAEVARRGRSRAAAHLRQARHSAGRTGDPRRRRADAGRGRRGLRLGFGRHHLQGRARQGGGDLLLVLGGGARARRAGAPISRLGRAVDRQFLRDAEFGGVLRRLVRLRAAGRALPDGAVDLFPHQRKEHRPVRAHADHRRQGRLRQLSRRLHRAQARREPASRRGGRARRARRRRDQVFDGAELVSRRRRGQGRHLQFRHQARRLPRRRARRSRGPRSRPVRRSPGNTRRASCAAILRAASSIRSPSPTAASRSTAAPR